ncbi:MAG: hypothetical protein U9R60_18745, partial [Bacteroidota bacterium]|nr:hypothetical protein [Bacteroidota bacterium]
SYASPLSKYYLSESLEKPMDRAISCLLHVQYSDGTIDLHTTNFHSTPDTAFIVNYLSPVYVILKRLERPGLESLLHKMSRFFHIAGKCFLIGGIHTPNHRWVVCSALARLNTFFPSQKYIDRIDKWLSEGIDMDPDGQYTEKSVSIYSPVCNNMFLNIGRLLSRPELHDVVRKNLEMTLYYIQPGGEVLTDASGRQDAARTGYVNRYYYSYRYFAIKDRNPVFSAVCSMIETRMPERIVSQLPELLEDPVFEEELISPTKIPDNYFQRFEHSGVFRIRRGNTDISIIEKNPTFLSFMKGKAVMQSMRLAAAFFGSKGQFISEETVFDNSSVVLSTFKKHGYYQPFPEEYRPEDGDWHKMPRGMRELSEAQTIHFKVAIRESDGNVSIEIQIDGTEHIPVSCEMSFRPGGELSGVTEDKHMEDSYFLESEMGEYKYGNDTIKFGPGIASHRWAQMRGMLDKQDGNSVYITGYTPFKHIIEIS